MFQRVEPVKRIGRTSVFWEALAWPGYEHLCLEERDSAFRYTVDGLIIAVLGEQPWRVWYRIELGDDWSVRSVRLAQAADINHRSDGPFEFHEPAFAIARSESGQWSSTGFTCDHDLDGCSDIDIAVTPFTNTLPIRRLELDDREAAEISVVYIRVPDLTLARARQRYTRLDASTYRFESLESGFTADISVDEQGLVTDYPELFRRVWPAERG